MAVPKRKNCKAKGRRRRGGHLNKLKTVATTSCPKCGELTIPHRVCPSCGNYRGKEIINLDSDE